MLKPKVDTPRDGRNWCDVVNKEPLPPPLTWAQRCRLDSLIGGTTYRDRHMWYPETVIPRRRSK